MANELIFFRGTPKGRYRYAGSFGDQVADIDLEIAKELKMVAALKRFAKRVCEDNGLKGMQIIRIGFMSITDTKEEYIRI